MCGVCGCDSGSGSTDAVRVLRPFVGARPATGSPDEATADPGAGQGHAHDHGHSHGPHHHHHHPHSHPHGPSAAVVPMPGRYGEAEEEASRLVTVERRLLDHNNALAAANRSFFLERGILALNLLSSPGAGKTSLLVRTIEALADQAPLAVIEGDQQTDRDARRIQAAGAPAVQVNTGTGCHLDAAMVARAAAALNVESGGLLFVENVGNLVCPAAFDLGEACRVVILSVTEGEDKPLKYPDIFQTADLLLINKMDLLPHVGFDLGRCLNYARRVKPDLEVIEVSATRGDGLDDWISWILARRADLSDAACLV